MSIVLYCPSAASYTTLKHYLCTALFLHTVAKSGSNTISQWTRHLIGFFFTSLQRSNNSLSATMSFFFGRRRMASVWCGIEEEVTLTVIKYALTQQQCGAPLR